MFEKTLQEFDELTGSRRVTRWLLIGTISFLILTAAVLTASAQSNPNLVPGQIPTAAQWNSYFSAKQDTLGFSPLRKGGDIMTGLLRFSMGVPVLTSCGTSPAINGNNQAGLVTMGTGSPTGCTITFNTNNPYSAVPVCIVSWQTNIASMQYLVTQTTITLTQTATSSNKVNYFCVGLQ